MLIRLMTIALLTVSLAACSSTKDEAADGAVTVGERQDGQGAGIDGAGVYGTDGSIDGVAGAGTQQDLATNVGDRVFFAYDSSDLAPEATATLARQAEWLNRYPNLQITVEGHSDERGTREYNIALGDRRANSVKNYLVSMGVSSARVNTLSYGKERPAVVGTDASSWAQNRRGVTTVQ